MRYLILGNGVSGKAAARFLINRGDVITIVDKSPQKEEGVISEQEVDVGQFDVLVVSPGIRKSHPIYAKALELRMEITGEMDLALSSLDPKIKVIGITGSNGKTTTTLMVSHILQSMGYKAPAVGNIGDPLCDHLLLAEEVDFYVCEISSYQLETMRSKVFDLVAITNITENHLDSYASFQEYIDTKLSLLDLRKSKAKAFISKSVIVSQKEIEIIADDNSAFALAMTKDLGISECDAQKALLSFKKPPHRLEKISDWKGVSFVNDSKSTTVHSTIYAIEQIKRPIILLAGGKNKGVTFHLWKELLLPYTKKIIAFGECAMKIRDDVYSALEVEICETLSIAFDKACSEAKEGDCILLSPGCASLDQFKNFEERGKVFIDLVKSLTKES
jgi:UDP-N-acetylmuramoylalanine--D-glutamate ligase